MSRLFHVVVQPTSSSMLCVMRCSSKTDAIDRPNASYWLRSGKEKKGADCTLSLTFACGKASTSCKRSILAFSITPVPPADDPTSKTRPEKSPAVSLEIRSMAIFIAPRAFRRPRLFPESEKKLDLSQYSTSKTPQSQKNGFPSASFEQRSARSPPSYHLSDVEFHSPRSRYKRSVVCWFLQACSEKHQPPPCAQQGGMNGHGSRWAKGKRTQR